MVEIHRSGVLFCVDYNCYLRFLGPVRLVLSQIFPRQGRRICQTTSSPLRTCGHITSPSFTSHSAGICLEVADGQHGGSVSFNGLQNTVAVAGMLVLFWALRTVCHHFPRNGMGRWVALCYTPKVGRIEIDAPFAQVPATIHLNMRKAWWSTKFWATKWDPATSSSSLWVLFLEYIIFDSRVRDHWSRKCVAISVVFQTNSRLWNSAFTIISMMVAYGFPTLLRISVYLRPHWFLLLPRATWMVKHAAWPPCSPWSLWSVACQADFI